MENKNNARWKYCAVGNIVRTRVDENGKVWHGTAAFRPGAKVYLQGKFWNENYKEIPVIGFTRGNKYKAMRVPIDVIENVHASRVFTPQVLDIMENWEFGPEWWHMKSSDQKNLQEFLERWNAYEDKRAVAPAGKKNNILKKFMNLFSTKR